MSVKIFYCKILLVVLVLVGAIPSLCQQNSSSDFKFHIVSKGETAYSISRKYNISLDKLHELNPNYEEVIKIGQSLKIPIESPIQYNNATTSPTLITEKSRGNFNAKTKKISESLFNNQFFYGFNDTSEFKLSVPPGVYSNNQEINVVVSKEGGGSYVIYTIDKDGAKKHFADTILISKSTVLKINSRDSLGKEKCYIGSYIIGVNHELPIVAIYVNHDQFFTEKGIYNGYTKIDSITEEILTIGNAWRKKPIPSFAQFYFQNKLIDELSLDVKTYGGMTLGWKEKSLQLSARKEKYGRGKIKVKLFESLPMDEFQHVVLRTSGNDQNKTRLLDMSISQVGEDIA